jgi:hypothetical protein
MVIRRIVGAAARAFLVASLIAIPATMLPGVTADTRQMITLLALLAAILTFVEYISEFPSLLEFRDAPPFNRMRFFTLFAIVVLLTLICVGDRALWGLGVPVGAAGERIGTAMDFPFSPVRMVVLLAPETAPDTTLSLIRSMAGLSYLVSLVALLCFVALVRLLDWPIRRRAFNFWVNLPLFDPTSGRDVLYRLKRDAHFNLALGFLLPFLIPALLRFWMKTFDSSLLATSETLIWVLCAWAFLPLTLMMRGVALFRVAALIEEKRRRAYAQDDELQLV